MADKGVRIPKRLKEFLNNADDAYMLAYATKNVTPMIPYADPAVCTALLQEILSGEEQYFGTSNLRNRKWSYVKMNGSTIQVVKELKHTPLSCGRNMAIALADAVDQFWDIRVDEDGSYKVTHIGEACLDED